MVGHDREPVDLTWRVSVGIRGEHGQKAPPAIGTSAGCPTENIITHIESIFWTKITTNNDIWVVCYPFFFGKAPNASAQAPLARFAKKERLPIMLTTIYKNTRNGIFEIHTIIKMKTVFYSHVYCGVGITTTYN